MRWDITQRMRAVDACVAQLADPRHRAIVQNYRRHAMLEACGLWEQILVPEMTVDEPVYRFHTPKGLQVVQGMQAVRRMHAGRAAENSVVSVHGDERIAVADWGFATEYQSHRYWPGRVLFGLGDRIDDPAAMYLVTMTQVVVWRCDDRARMREVQVYRGADRAVRKLPAAAVITVEECREKLVPRLPPVEACSVWAKLPGT